MALYSAQIDVEFREITFKNKPPTMLEVSPKGTVPVLVLDDGTVIDESWDIMLWALSRNDPENLQVQDDSELKQVLQLVEENDNEFKTDLDNYKYADRYPRQTPEQYRQRAERFLQHLEICLNRTSHLVREPVSLVDIALFPFIRQFAMVDIDWFNRAPYPALRNWLNEMLGSGRFRSVMGKNRVWEF
jgi:glutathione S-transferase